MPLHEWRCRCCGTITEVMRKVGDHDVVPREEERQCPCREDEGPARLHPDENWEKTLTRPPSEGYSTNWTGYGGGGKGRW